MCLRASTFASRTLTNAAAVDGAIKATSVASTRILSLTCPRRYRSREKLRWSGQSPLPVKAGSWLVQAGPASRATLPLGTTRTGTLDARSEHGLTDSAAEHRRDTHAQSVALCARKRSLTAPRLAPASLPCARAAGPTSVVRSGLRPLRAGRAPAESHHPRRSLAIARCRILRGLM